jgi:parallel beta-helix repeat protein
MNESSVRSMAVVAAACCFLVGSAVPAYSLDVAPRVLVVGSGGPAPQCQGGGYASIARALDAASPGDVIELCPGLYDETLAVNKTVTIRATPDAAAALAAVDCLGDGPVIPDPSTQVVFAQSKPFAGPLLTLAADGIEVSGLVLPGPGHVNDMEQTGGIMTSPDHSGYFVHDNLIQGQDVGIYFASDGSSPSSVASNCLRANGWAVANDFEPLADARIHHNLTTRNEEFTFEQTPGVRSVVLDHNRSRNDNIGYLFLGTDSTFAVENVVEGVGFEAMRFTGTTATVAEENVVQGTTFGLRIFGANRELKLLGNDLVVGQGGVVSPTNNQGLPVPPNFDVRIAENRISGARSGPGIGIGGGALQGNSVISENVIHGLRGEGIVLLARPSDSSTAKIIENIVTGNGGDGIRIANGVVGSTIEQNYAIGNGTITSLAVDIRSQAPLSANTWSENVCITDSPDGICVD